MRALLKRFIMEALAEMQDARVPNQLVSKKSGKKKAEEETEEMEEMSSVAGGNVMGFSGPLGLDSEDLKGPGAGPKRKKSRKDTARWK